MKKLLLMMTLALAIGGAASTVFADGDTQGTSRCRQAQAQVCDE